VKQKVADALVPARAALRQSWFKEAAAETDKAFEKAERKRMQVEHAAPLSQRAKLVKLADKICNVRDVPFRRTRTKLGGASPQLQGVESLSWRDADRSPRSSEGIAWQRSSLSSIRGPHRSEACSRADCEFTATSPS
jgi:hypothetical protein